MRSYNPSMETEIAVRMEINADGTGRLTSIFGELDTNIPPMSPILEAKYAMLKLCSKGTRVPDVGKRQSENIFYLWISQEEFEQIKQEITNVRRNTMDGGSVGQT